MDDLRQETTLVLWELKQRLTDERELETWKTYLNLP